MLCASAIALGIATTSLHAAMPGSIRGRVTDPASSPIGGVHIVVSAPGLPGAARTAVTTAEGLYSVPDLPTGAAIELTASADTYATTTVSDIQVLGGQATTVNIVLVPARDVREQVRVKAQPDLLEQESTGSTHISDQFIDALPLLGRNYQDVLTLAPGVTDVDGDGNPNIHGARDTSVITLVDGVNTTDPLTGKVGMQMNIESIEEIEVKTSAATAEFSRAQGGFANILTRSGGNQFEGTFKFLWRGSALDGDGAGTDSPALHAGLNPQPIGHMSFNDLLGFLSLGGPIVRDHAWYFVTFEAMRNEEPINAITNAYIATTKEKRLFGKATWQISANNRLVFSVQSDPQQFLNQGLNSYTKEEAGFTQEQGGNLFSLRDTAILSPQTSLETTVAFYDGKPGIVPNLGPDTNGNGVLYNDWNGNGFHEARERDAGEDYDGDGRFDVYEDPNHNGIYDYGEDLDGDGIITHANLCEGTFREDKDCDGRLDTFNEDVNGNGLYDDGEDKDHDGHIDFGDEDRNGNGKLDDTPFPTSVYPYGRLTPLPQDKVYTLDLVHGVTSGPYYDQVSDDRRRATLRQDLSLFVPDFHGAHDLKTGYLVEREQFSRETVTDELIAARDFGGPFCRLRQCIYPSELPPQVVHAVLPVEPDVHGDATGQTAGIYLQDSFRPVPSVSLGLGLRVDREVAHAAGYTPFDPAAEGPLYRRIAALRGAERGLDDLVNGNNDGVESLGVLSDPFAGGGTSVPTVFADLQTQLQKVDLKTLTGPRSAVLFSTPQLLNLLGSLGVSEFDPAALASVGLRQQAPENFGITNTNLSPRLSVAWDPTADGRSRLFATWGRYYDRLFLSTIVAEQGPDRVARYYNLDKWGVDVDYQPYPIGHLSTSSNHHIGTTLTEAPASIHMVDRNLRTPYSDELTMGFEREVHPETVLSLRYVRRDYRDQLQDVDVNHEVRVDPQTGELADRIGLYEAPTKLNASPTRRPDGRPDLFIQNLFFNEVLKVGNYNEARYHALELELRKRLSHRWEMLGSYTYSRAVGSAEDFQSQLGNDPSTVESEFGYLDYDQRHVVKANLSTFLPHDWQVGFSSTWSSGLPYSVISRFFSLDNADYQQFRTRYGFTEFDGTSLRFHTLQRNSERNNAVLDLNAKVRKNFVLGRNVAALSFEVFNILNSDDLRIMSYEPNRFDGFDPATFSQLSATTIDATRRFGRRYQIGFQVQF